MAKLPRFLDKKNPLEKVIEKKVCDYGLTLGHQHRKYSNPSRRAAMDQAILTPRPRHPRKEPKTWFIEFKSLGKKPTDAQLEEHEFYRKLGYEVFVIDNIEEGKWLMRLMAEPQ